MATTTPTHTEGLRVRKKRATENAIESSAVELALELGIEHVTVEMICERADISRSTFFNYFAGRDYAIVGRAIQSLEGEEAAEVLGKHPNDLARGVVELIFASIGHQHMNSDVARKRAQLSAEQPEAQRLSSISMLEGSVSLIPVVVEWIAANPETLRGSDPLKAATMAVTAAHAVIASLLIDLSTVEGDSTPGDAEIEQAFRELRALLNVSPELP